MGGRRRLGPMKATAEATPAYTAGVLPDPFVARTFIDPSWASWKWGSPFHHHLQHQPMISVGQWGSELSFALKHIPPGLPTIR